MNTEVITCDGPGCKVRQQIQPALYGNAFNEWIVVKRSTSDSDDTISSGRHHFCSERCLRKRLGVKP